MQILLRSKIFFTALAGLLVTVFHRSRLRQKNDETPVPQSTEQRIPLCHLLLLIATDTELKALEQIASQNGDFEKRNSSIGEYYDLGMRGTNHIIAIKVRIGPLRYGGAAAQAILFRIATGATGIIAVGTAFGVNPKNQNIGDILVATHMLPYDDRRVYTQKVKHPQRRTKGQLRFVVNRPRVKITMQNTKYNRWGHDRRSQINKTVVDRSRAIPRGARTSLVEAMKRHTTEWSKSKVHFGRLLSGSAQIQSSHFRDELTAAFDYKVVGGDMEAIALAANCDPKYSNWAVVKAISDFGDEDRDRDIEKGRILAAENAIRFSLEALSKMPGEET